MSLLENIVQDLDHQEKLQLIDILKKDTISTELENWKERYNAAEQRKDVVEMIAIKGKMHDLSK